MSHATYLAQRALESVQEEWEIEHGQTDGDTNVQLTALFPGPVATNLINNTILGALIAIVAGWGHVGTLSAHDALGA